MLNELAKEIHDNAVEHGWWDEERNFGEVIALCHSELSEALEERRAGRPMEYFFDTFVGDDEPFCNVNMEEADGAKTEGIAVELCDCIIRVLDYLATTGVDIDAVMRRKMDYNKTRPYKHGKNF